MFPTMGRDFLGARSIQNCRNASCVLGATISALGNKGNAKCSKASDPFPGTPSSDPERLTGPLRHEKTLVNNDASSLKKTPKQKITYLKAQDSATRSRWESLEVFPQSITRTHSQERAAHPRKKPPHLGFRSIPTSNSGYLPWCMPNGGVGEASNTLHPGKLGLPCLAFFPVSQTAFPCHLRNARILNGVEGECRKNKGEKSLSIGHPRPGRKKK